MQPFHLGQHIPQGLLFPRPVFLQRFRDLLPAFLLLHCGFPQGLQAFRFRAVGHLLLFKIQQLLPAFFLFLRRLFLLLDQAFPVAPECLQLMPQISCRKRQPHCLRGAFLELPAGFRRIGSQLFCLFLHLIPGRFCLL